MTSPINHELLKREKRRRRIEFTVIIILLLIGFCIYNVSKANNNKQEQIILKEE
jgi:hypothetical protein